MTEAELASRLHRDLGPLATDAGWSSTATAGQSYGHYSDAIDDAKAVSGVMTLSTATARQLTTTRERAYLHCLNRLELHYSLLVDTTTGGESGAAVAHKLSQVQQAIAKVRAWADDRRNRVATGGKLRGYSRPDYNLGEGDVVTEL